MKELAMRFIDKEYHSNLPLQIQVCLYLSEKCSNYTCIIAYFPRLVSLHKRKFTTFVGVNAFQVKGDNYPVFL